MSIRPSLLRRSLAFWHRWFGLLAAGWVFVFGLTGSILVFYQEIDRGLNPEWRAPRPDGAVPRVDPLIAAAEAGRSGAHVFFIDLPDDETEPARMSFAGREGFADPPSGLQVFGDPFTGALLGERRFGAPKVDRAHFATIIYQLHVNLMLGPVFTWLAGLVAFLWIFDHIAAAVLAFPAARKWAQSFRIRDGAKGHKLVFDVHRAGGLWLYGVTLVLAISGVYFNWYDDFRAAVAATLQTAAFYSELAPDRPAPIYAAAISADAAIAIAERRAGAAADSLLIEPRKGHYEVRLFDSRDVKPYGGRSIYVDMMSGAVLADEHAAAGGAGNAVLAWQYPLHSGQAFGWPGRILIFIAGLSVCVFSATGVMIWARKRKARRASAGRRLGVGRPAGPMSNSSQANSPTSSAT